MDLYLGALEKMPNANATLGRKELKRDITDDGGRRFVGSAFCHVTITFEVTFTLRNVGRVKPSTMVHDTQYVQLM